jgi:hypothetical protein
MLLYHLDRSNSLQLNSNIQLKPLVSYNPSETTNFINSLFENGVSCMGQTYLNFCNYSDSDLANTFNIEFIFESVRRENFRDIPSRFTSIFATQTLEQLKVWYSHMGYDKTSIAQPSIKVIETNNSFRFDASWRDIQILDNNQNRLFSPFAYYYYAQQYWSGKIGSYPRMEMLCPLPVSVIDTMPIETIL